jgi:hypothetical protein
MNDRVSSFMANWSQVWEVQKSDRQSGCHDGRSTDSRQAMNPQKMRIRDGEQAIEGMAKVKVVLELWLQTSSYLESLSPN